MRKLFFYDTFWKNTITSDKCWIWTGGRDGRGYGQMYFQGYRVKSHRYSWELFNGKIPKNKTYHGLCVLHKCDNRNCVNPAHLFLGTHKENMDDMSQKGRSRHAGLIGENNPKAKLNKNQVLEIRKISLTSSQREIANRFNLSQSTVSQIIRKERWTHL